MCKKELFGYSYLNTCKGDAFKSKVHAERVSSNNEGSLVMEAMWCV